MVDLSGGYKTAAPGSVRIQMQPGEQICGQFESQYLHDASPPVTT